MKTKILFISPNLSSGGAERQIVTVALLLKDRGYKVEFLCYAEGNFYEHILQAKSIKVNWILLPNYLRRMLVVRRFIRKGGYDTVISFLEIPCFLNNFAAIGGKKWKVITGERNSKESTFTSVKNKIFCKFQKYSDCIVCNSENARQMWLRHYSKYASKLKVIYNTVTLQPISTEYVPKRDGRLHIVVAASYQYLKNPIGVVRALFLMSEEERKTLRIDWYGKTQVAKGDTRAYDEAVSLIKEYGLEQEIALHEATKEIHNRMNEADVVGLFSSVEGLPNAICEAMSLGKPIIMSKVSDYRVLVDEANGYLCDWDSVESIKVALLHAASLSAEELKQKGEQSQRKAKKLFSAEDVIDKWEKIATK